MNAEAETQTLWLKEGLYSFGRDKEEVLLEVCDAYTSQVMHVQVRPKSQVSRAWFLELGDW